jgi:hypothetical protein
MPVNDSDNSEDRHHKKKYLEEKVLKEVEELLQSSSPAVKHRPFPV